MFIAHLPGSYLLTNAQLKLPGIGHDQHFRPYLMTAGLFAVIAPGLFMVYFYLVDDRQTLHHDYLVHIPFFWLAAFAGMIGLSATLASKYLFNISIVIFADLLLHLFLEPIVDKIKWLWPVSDHAFYLFDVPAAQNHWVLNFVLHWTFAFEIALIGGAFWLLLKRRPKTALTR